jgi:hypothetical protein
MAPCLMHGVLPSVLRSEGPSRMVSHQRVHERVVPRGRRGRHRRRVEAERRPQLGQARLGGDAEVSFRPPRIFYMENHE